MAGARYHLAQDSIRLVHLTWTHRGLIVVDQMTIIYRLQDFTKICLCKEKPVYITKVNYSYTFHIDTIFM